MGQSPQKRSRRHGLSVAIAAVVLLAFLVPTGGAILLDGGVVDGGIVAVMLLGGMKIPFGRFRYIVQRPLPVIVAMASIFVLAPAVAVWFGTVYGFSIETDRLSVLILTSQATTLATGIVLTEVAGGDVALAVVVSVLSNLFSAVATPLVFEILGDTAVTLNPLAMMESLALKVALPVAAGQLLRIPFRSWVSKHAKKMTLFSQGVILLILYSGISAGQAHLQGGVALLLKILLFALLLHGILLTLNGLIARLLSPSPAVRAAFVLTASEKTLPAAILIWKGQFQSLPLGAMIAVCYHLIQLVTDSILAPGFRNLPLIRGKKGRDQ